MVHDLKNKKVCLEEKMKSDISDLRPFHSQHRMDIVNLLEEESSQFKSVVEDGTSSFFYYILLEKQRVSLRFESGRVSKQGLNKEYLNFVNFCTISCLMVAANESFERVASVGLKANMILYLKTEYHLSSATGANILFLWGAISGFMPTLGAFLSDSYFGRFGVIGMGSIFSLIGMTSLWLTAVFPAARSFSCDLKVGGCAKPTHAQIALLFTSFAIMSIGAGWIRPCSLAFGADQFDRPENPKNAKILQRYFNWYYASVGISVMVSVTVIVYIQTVKGWIVGFGIPAGLMLLSIVMFFLGSSVYVKVKANKSMFSDFFKLSRHHSRTNILINVDSRTIKRVLSM